MKNLFSADKPFALIRRQNEKKVLCLSGSITKHDKLADIARKGKETPSPTLPARGREPVGSCGAVHQETSCSSPLEGEARRGVTAAFPPLSGEIFDTLSILPFRQVEELGFVAQHGDEKILTLNIEAQEEVALDQMLALLPDEACAMEGELVAVPDDAAFAAMTQRIIDEEIGNGAGCNFVVPRFFCGKIAAFSLSKALSAYRRLLENEYGTYWTFLFYTGEQIFIGATPERHLSVQQGRVKMNPISGTFRKMEHSEPESLPALDLFLKDQKEIFELLMVVDEELKMMAEICSEGGQVVGPMVKEMSKLIHTEYVLAGQSKRDVVDMLRESMFAATVVGSPIENACRINHRHQSESRRYYGGALALLGRDAAGRDTLDSPITIRMAEIALDGSFEIGAGATIVRDSDPESETAETKTKARGTLSALGLFAGANDPVYRLGADVYGEDQMLSLCSRNARLSRFWIEDQGDARVPDKRLAGKKVVIIDNEDNFTRMLAHMFRALGLAPRIVKNASFDPLRDEADVVVLGPGPGDPRDLSDPRIAKANALCRAFLEQQKPLLCVCLGHQILCHTLGLPLAKKQKAFQGAQERIDLWGQNETVGFYNTFTGKVDGVSRGGMEISFDEQTGEVHALRGPAYLGLQFHPESILTTNGLRIVQDALLHLLAVQKGGSL